MVVEDVSQATPRSPRPGRPRLRVWAALAAAVLAFISIPLGILPIAWAVPVIGVVLSLGTGPDGTPGAKSIAAAPRNGVLALVMGACLAVVVFTPELEGWLLTWFGASGASLVTTLLAVAVLALPLAMTESPAPIADSEPNRLVATRRNLAFSLTVVVIVAVWYAGPGESILAIAALIFVMPVVLLVSRARAARRREVEALWSARGPGRGLQRAQAAGVIGLCLLVAGTLRTGAYDAASLGMTETGHKIFVIAFSACCLLLAALAVVPRRHPRVGSMLMVAIAIVFIGTQLVMTYRPATDAVSISSPLSREWYVVQGGHSELVNYHHVIAPQRDALDITELVAERTHPTGNTSLTSYYVYGQPVLAPDDGVVTYVQDDRPDQKIGAADARYPCGNGIVLDIGAHYLLLCHLQEGSVTVKVGDPVHEGERIAQVGNSGDTSEPHLHLQAQDSPIGFGDIEKIDGARYRSWHTYPLTFRRTALHRGGREATSAAADPRRGDRLRPVS